MVRPPSDVTSRVFSDLQAERNSINGRRRIARTLFWFFVVLIIVVVPFCDRQVTSQIYRTSAR